MGPIVDQKTERYFQGKFTYLCNCIYFYIYTFFIFKIFAKALTLILRSLRVDEIDEDECVKKEIEGKDQHLTRWEAEEESVCLEETESCIVTESKGWEQQGVTNNRKCTRKVKENIDWLEQMIICVLKHYHYRMRTEAYLKSFRTRRVNMSSKTNKQKKQNWKATLIEKLDFLEIIENWRGSSRRVTWFLKKSWWRSVWIFEGQWVIRY